MSETQTVKASNFKLLHTPKQYRVIPLKDCQSTRHSYIWSHYGRLVDAESGEVLDEDNLYCIPCFEEGLDDESVQVKFYKSTTAVSNFRSHLTAHGIMPQEYVVNANRDYTRTPVPIRKVASAIKSSARKQASKPPSKAHAKVESPPTHMNRALPPEMLSPLLNSGGGDDDEYEKFGKFIASELRQIKNERLRISAKHNIQKVLMEAQIQCLD